MKRIVSFLLVLVMLMSSVVFFPTVSTAAATAGKGDVNEDGVVSIKDSLVLRKYMSAIYEPNNEENFKTLADINSDGRVNSKDNRYMKMYLVCEITSFDNLSALPSKPTVTIAGNNLQNYVIVIPDEWVESGVSLNNENAYYYGGEVNPVHYAARSMRVYINDFFTGGLGSANLKTASQATNDRYRIELVVDETTYGDDGFNIKVENGNVYITASSKRGMIYGTTEFLEKYLQGKFFANGSANYADTEKAFDIPNGIDDTQHPGFEYRAMVGYTTSLAQDDEGSTVAHYYNSRRKINGYGTTDRSGTNKYSYSYSIGRLGRYNAHSIYPYCNNWNENGAAYTPCLSATETYNKVIAAIDADIAAHQSDFNTRIVLNRELVQMSCSMQDHNNVCACSTCVSKYQTYGCFNAVYFEFLNKVADHYYPIYGDQMKIFSILYDRTYPEAFFSNAANLPRSNMVLCYCQSGCGNHTLDGAGCVGKSPSPVINVWGSNIGKQYYCYGDGNNINEMSRIEKFGALSNTLEAQNGEAFDFYVWYYPTNVHYYVCPSPNYFNILKDMRLLADAGVDGIYFESDTSIYAFEGMRDFLAAEAMWNPYMSQAEYEQLMDNWLARYCGDGWRYVKKYLLMNEAATDGVGCWVNNYDAPWTMVSKSYYAENYAVMKDLFTSAYNLANNDEQRDFILRARVHCDFLGLSALWNQRDSYNGYWTEYNRMYDYLTSGVTTYCANGGQKVSHGYFALGAAERKVGSRGENPMVWIGLD